MIYTQFGVPIEIVGKSGNEVFVRAADESGWEAWRSIGDLKADAGSKEITDAWVLAPEKERPTTEPAWKERLRKTLNESEVF